MIKLKCPRCKSKEVCKIPSSTLPIKDESTYLYGKKVSEEIIKKHLSINHICGGCNYEW